MSNDPNEALNRAMMLLAAKIDRNNQQTSLMDIWEKVHPMFKVAMFVASGTWMVYNNFVRMDVYKEDSRSVQSQISSIHARMEKESGEMRAYIDAKFRESNEHSDSNRKSMEQQLTLINDNIKTLLLERDFTRRR